MIHIGAILDQVFAQAPVAMKASPIQVKILSECGQILTVRDQEPDCANVPVICAPSNQRVATGVGGCWIAIRKVFEDQVGSTIDDTFQHETRISERRRSCVVAYCLLKAWRTSKAQGFPLNLAYFDAYD